MHHARDDFFFRLRVKNSDFRPQFQITPLKYPKETSY